ncbi:hypothetical protein [Streptomyces sp. NPDC087512]|uniref:hypothetical protein n=1 Tax=unclassified Streptomyces TaxID=2593676 RepID=UPI003446EE89
MADGDGVVARGVRIRLDGTASESDIGALHKWLEREQPLDALVRAGRLRIDERRRTDETGAPMGIGMEIVVALAGSVSAVMFQEVLNQVKGAVDAWRANRSEVEDGEPPEGRVEPVDLDDR